MKDTALYEKLQYLKLTSPKQVLQAVAQEWNLPYKALLGQERSRKFAVPKQFSTFIVRYVLDFPLEATALFLRKNSKTIVSRCNAISNLYDTDKEFKELVDKFINNSPHKYTKIFYGYCPKCVKICVSCGEEF